MMSAKRRPFPLLLLLATTGLIAAGCGGGNSDSKSDVTPERRVELCLEQQPESTKTDCEGWEDDGQLANDGKHKGHDSMG